MPSLVSRNPADDFRPNGRVACTTAAGIAAAAARAQAGAAAWSALPVPARVRALRPLVALLRRDREELARLITAEMGKPLHEARDEVDTTAAEVEYLLECGAEALREVVHREDDVRRDVLRREPWGVAAVIAPWNYPLEISMWGIVPNLVCGNTVLYKPSELVPLLAARLDSLFAELELGAGVLQTVFGRARESRQLVARDEVNLIWFTGSSSVGQRVYAGAGRRFVKAVLELGGSSPTIVLDDVAVTDELVDHVVGGRFTNCGQICSATKRLLVHRAVHNELVEAVVARVRRLRVGDPLDDATAVSSLASRRQLEVVQAQLRDAVRRGGRVECGGTRWRGRGGAFLLPAVVTRTTRAMRLLREEVFGPVLPVMPFDDDAEAIRLANDTPFGLSAEVYSPDEERAMAVARRIDAGRITINSPRLPGISCPFGGFKRSGMGREHGPWGFHELSQLKHVMVRKQGAAAVAGAGPQEIAG